MALCPKCERALPANGNCMYCGKLEGLDPYKKQGRSLGPWVGYGIKFLVAAGLLYFAYWLIFTEPGRAFGLKVKEAIGLGSSEDNDDEWTKALKKYPKVKEMLNNKINYQVEDEVIEGEPSIRRIAIQRKSGTEFMQWVFRVNKDTGEVTGENFEAQSILLEK